MSLFNSTPAPPGAPTGRNKFPAASYRFRRLHRPDWRSRCLFFFIAFADSRTRVNFFAGHPLRSFRQKRTSLRAHLARLHEAHASMMSPTPSDPPPTLKKDDLHFVAMMDRALAEAWRWDEPELDEIILSAIESSHRRAEEGEGEWSQWHPCR